MNVYIVCTTTGVCAGLILGYYLGRRRCIANQALFRASAPVAPRLRAAEMPLKAAPDGNYDYTLDIVLSSGLNLLRESLRNTIKHYESKGWAFHSLSSDYKGAGGCWLVFRRPRADQTPAADSR